MSTEEKHAAVKRVVASVAKRYKLEEDSMIITTADKMSVPEKIPTGILSLDRCLDGGFDCGKYTVMTGDYTSGKSTMCLMLIANAQKMGKKCVLINAECRFDPAWAEVQGVDNKELELVTPQGASAEAVLDLFRELCTSEAAGLVVVDSITSLSGSQEQKRTLEQDTMALNPRLLSQFFRMSVGATHRSNVCGVLISQMRDTMNQYSKEIDKITGGRAQKYYSKYIVATSRKGAKEEYGMSYDDGFTMGIKLLKATGPGEGVSIELPFRYGSGIDTLADTVSVAISDGYITSGGSGFYTISKEITGGDEERIRGYANLLGLVVEKGYDQRLRELLLVPEKEERKIEGGE